MDDEIGKEIVKQSGEVLSKGYDDLVHPSAEALGQIVSYLPRTVRVFMSKWERWIVNGEESLELTGKVLKDKVSLIPEEKLCEPEPYVAIPAIQQIAYCYDSEELREMYANLLASSMNMDKKWAIHPGYVDIIKQITPDEAKIMKQCPSSSLQYIPLINLQIHYLDKRGNKTLLRHYSKIAEEAGCDNPENISQCLDNLSRLMLINIPDDMHLIEESFYEPLINSAFIKEIKDSYLLQEREEFHIEKKLFYVTDFGVGFKKCCID